MIGYEGARISRYFVKGAGQGILLTWLISAENISEISMTMNGFAEDVIWYLMADLLTLKP
uniref:Uncharacterized protein n=1 Tax=viral metagenome TaxID=1070528 RepID=A0A6M3J071_9ZZZZ